MDPTRLIDAFNVDIINRELIRRLGFPCTPRILIVTEFDLGYGTNGFGLRRVLEALTTDSGVTLKPRLTLAFRRGLHATPVVVGGDSYAVLNDFDFAAAPTPVTVANYDQIWLFGRHTNSASDLRVAEIEVIARFMNAGGGVFATGDHGSIGNPMCGRLPRIRRMRDWASVPMGGEADMAVAVNRIDTVVDPGANNLYEFEDQGDAIPQRIFPHYRVVADGATRWKATIHPLLRLPGAPAFRDGSSGNANFTLDIDVLPDHPHESVCHAVTSPALLGATYSVGGGSTMSFAEFPASAATPATRVPAELVASGVSGGRSVWNGVWKPPVTPRMFGLVSAWDGRLAARYPGQTQRPGRIVCDSTWHHYVNVNLDGMGSFAGSVFTPNANLRKIYAYYRNIQAWLQPANRIWCRLWWDIEIIRVHSRFVEELSELPLFEPWKARVGLGREVLAALREDGGADADHEFVDALFASSEADAALANLLNDPGIEASSIDADTLRAGVVGSLLIAHVEAFPEHDPKAVLRRLEAGPQKAIGPLLCAAREAVAEGVAAFGKQAERTLTLAKALQRDGGGREAKPAPAKPKKPKKKG